MIGRIHSTESFGTVDGPGIRFVVFLMGCPLRCLYCHNPDTWTGGGTPMEAKDVLREILKYKSYLKGGGVTLSGGEPLLQLDFCIDLLTLCKQEGLHTAIDTAAYPFDGSEKYEELLAVTDLFLLDIKHIDDETYRKITGRSNQSCLAFAKYLSDRRKPMWIRHVLFSGTDDDASLRSLRAFIGTLSSVEKVQVLPYHTLGKEKYEKLSIPYPLTEAPPSAERVENAKIILTEVSQ